METKKNLTLLPDQTSLKEVLTLPTMETEQKEDSSSLLIKIQLIELRLEEKRLVRRPIERPALKKTSKELEPLLTPLLMVPGMVTEPEMATVLETEEIGRT